MLVVSVRVTGEADRPPDALACRHPVGRGVGDARPRHRQARGAAGRIHPIGQVRSCAARRVDLRDQRLQAGVGVRDVEPRLLAGAGRRDRRHPAARRGAGSQLRRRELVRPGHGPALQRRLVHRVQHFDVGGDVVRHIKVELAVRLVVVLVLNQVVEARILEVTDARVGHHGPRPDQGREAIGRPAIGGAADVRQRPGEARRGEPAGRRADRRGGRIVVAARVAGAGPAAQRVFQEAVDAGADRPVALEDRHLGTGAVAKGD